jgi:putative transposase
VLELRPQYPVAGLLKVADLKRSTFYHHQKALQAGDKYAELKEQIQAIYDLHKGRYGYRRIAETVRQMGYLECPNTVQKIMDAMGLKSLVRIKKYKSFKGEIGEAAPNTLDRNFDAEGINEKWVTDVTEFKVGGRRLFLSTLMDLCTSEIVAFETDTRPSLNMVIEMAKKAFSTLGCTDNPILHSDQGWQYRMRRYKDMLKKNFADQSMSRKGNCHDNAAMESFFGTLKAEFFNLNKFTSVEHLQTGLAEYIHYYNHDRIKMKLGGLSPAQYRIQLAAA